MVDALVDDAALARRACCNNIVHGFTVSEFVDVDDVVRDISVLEFWAGVGLIATAARAQGLRAETIELTTGRPTDDLLSYEGFRHAVGLVLRLKKDGLLWLAPVCSTFVWLRSSQAKRCPENDYKGDQTNESICEGNRGADVAAFLFVLAWARSAQVALENTPGSTIWKYPAVRTVLETLPGLHFGILHRCVFDEAEHGERYGKLFKVLASGPWVRSPGLIEKCSCLGRVHTGLVDRKGAAIRGRLGDLTASQAYPCKLGLAVISAWQTHGSCVLVTPPASSDRVLVLPSRTARTSARRTKRMPSSDDDASAEPPRQSRAPKSRRLLVSSSDVEEPVPTAPPLVVQPRATHKSWQTADSGSS